MPAVLNKTIKKILIKISLFVFLFVSISTLFVSKTNAQVIDTAQDINNLWNHTWYSEQNPFAWYQKVYDESVSPSSEIFGERYTAAQVQWITYSLWAQVWNMIPGNPELTNCLVSGSGDSCTESLNKVLDLIVPIGTINTPNTASGIHSVLTAIGQNPISGIDYFKNILGKYSPVKEAQAQTNGFGYGSAGKISQNLWGITRNISFSFIILAIITMSFMIMFRVKISPQLVISVQSSLPKIIATIILITFSYAIAGFAIDLMYVVIGLIAGILTNSKLSGHVFTDMFNELNLKNSAFDLMYQYWVVFIWNSLTTIVSNFNSLLASVLLIIFAILSIFAIMWWSIKIIFMLLKNFAMVILTIVLGPLQIMVGLFTGKSTFGGWFRKLISHLVVYPLMGVMFFFAFFFLVQGSNDVSTANTIFGSPTKNVITDNEWLPPFSGFALGDNIIWIVISFVIFSNITKVTEIIQAALAGKPFEFGSAMGEALAGPKSIAGMAGNYYETQGKWLVENNPASPKGPAWVRRGRAINSILGTFR